MGKKYIRDSLRCFIISFSLYLIFVTGITICALKDLPDYSFKEIWIRTAFIPYAFVFLIPSIYYLVINIIYLFLFMIAKFNGIKCSAKITEIEIKNKLLNPRARKYKFVLMTSEGLIKRSCYYKIKIQQFHELYPESICTVYCWRNMVFITSIQ